MEQEQDEGRWLDSDSLEYENEGVAQRPAHFSVISLHPACRHALMHYQRKKRVHIASSPLSNSEGDEVDQTSVRPYK